jgi:8-oxo-dGTP diphosphatase
MTEAEAAVAMVRALGPEESILLIRRAEREEDSWSGHWSFPGGRRDRGDHDLLHTALRELEEECGIRLAREQLEAELPQTLARRKVGRFVEVSPFVFRVDCELPTVLDPREAAEALWAPLRMLLDPARHALRSVPGRPAEMLFPAVELNGAPLWGFTYRLITDWLGLGPSQRPIEQAGFEAACILLDFLLSHGLTLKRGWADSGAIREVAKAAEVNGTIPVTLVRAHFSTPERYMPALNCLEVCPDHIRIVGPAFEQYLIAASG